MTDYCIVMAAYTDYRKAGVAIEEAFDKHLCASAQAFGFGDAARTVLALLVVALVLLACWRAFDRPWHRAVSLFTLVLGFGASMAVGLSPTAFVSFPRTMLMGWFALVVVALVAYRALPKSLAGARFTVCGAIITSALMVLAYSPIL